MNETTHPPRADANRAYHADSEFIGKSGLDLIARSPAHYWARYLDPNRVEPEPTPAMRFGELVHSVLLEPERAAADYVVMPAGLDRRTKEGKAWCAENETKLIVSASDWDTATRMREVLMANAFVRQALERGVAEQAVRTTHPDTWAGLKAKPDWFDARSGLVLDLKTTADAHPDEFAKSVVRYRYHVQEAFYRDVLRWAGYEVKRFVFAAIEKEPPYALAVYDLEPEAVELGRQLYERDLTVYAACKDSGIWPAYNPEPRTLNLPAWAYR